MPRTLTKQCVFMWSSLSSYKLEEDLNTQRFTFFSILGSVWCHRADNKGHRNPTHQLLICWCLTGEELMTMIMLIWNHAKLQSKKRNRPLCCCPADLLWVQIKYKSALKNLFFINLTFRQFCGLKSMSWLFVTGWKTKCYMRWAPQKPVFVKHPQTSWRSALSGVSSAASELITVKVVEESR